MANSKTNKQGIKIWMWSITLIIIVGIIITGKNKYDDIYKSNINFQDNETTYLYIPTGSTYKDLVDILQSDHILSDTASFKWVADRKNLKSHVNPGRYKITSIMSNNDLVNLIRSGKQTTIRVSFIKTRTKENFAGKISRFIEADSLSILKAIKNDSLIKNIGFDKNTIMSVFIPNSYDFYWNTTADVFIKRMFQEYNRFWNNKRSKKVKEMGMLKTDISTLASIIEEETNKDDEKKRIAGVYLNRLNKHIPLQADPTIKFAVNDFKIKRITKKLLKTKSPYNTYRHAGLPPGPICTPSIASIDAVLHHEVHEYYYFCAKDDFSGYHTFSKTLKQHNLQARKYHNALNKKRIYK
ncbi:MAG: endolytic transglycosylase MltG [Bacteroidota bacterium]|nr:endolytic transglycosylase MltG [Bacteroidota bacterium]